MKNTQEYSPIGTVREALNYFSSTVTHILLISPVLYVIQCNEDR